MAFVATETDTPALLHNNDTLKYVRQAYFESKVTLKSHMK